MGFRLDGELKSAYNHWDSYPTGLGNDILEFLRATANNRDDILADIRKLTAVDPDVEPTEEQIRQLTRYADTNVSTRQLTEWYVLLRETQGNPLKTLMAGFFEPFPVGEEEWSYVMDFDADTLEVWEGRELVRSYPMDQLPENFSELEEELSDY
jgi:tetrahydromethanopterin S-methyltransferase subunit B